MADRKHLRERPTAEDDTWPSLCPCPTSRNAENTTLAVDRQEPASAKTSQPACFCLSPCGLETDAVSATTTLGERVPSKSRPDRGMLVVPGAGPHAGWCGPACGAGCGVYSWLPASNAGLRACEAIKRRSVNLRKAEL